MMYARTHEQDYEAQPSRAILPEQLGAEGVRLLTSDAIAALVLVAASTALGAMRDGWLTVLTILLTGALLGRYRRSLAATPKDEWYATISVALASIAPLCVLVPLFQVSWLISAAILAVWSIAGSVAATLLTRHRRGDQGVVVTTNFLTAVSRRAPRNPLLRGTIAAIDFTLAAILTVVLSPVLLACAIAVAFERHGPILLLQRRVGVDGREFRMFKFRTVKEAASDDLPSAEDGDRYTKVGRFLQRTTLAELPQLCNVLRGEMSLVGPRPDMIEYSDRFVHTVPFYEDRQAIPPGISGWAQIEHGGSFARAKFQQVLPYDLFYVANYSISLYLFCLVKTAFEVFHHRAD